MIRVSRWRLVVALSTVAVLVGAGIAIASAESAKPNAGTANVAKELALTKLNHKFSVFRRGTLSDHNRAHAATASASLVEKLQISLGMGPEHMIPSTAVGTTVGSFPVVVVASSNKMGVYHQGAEGAVGGSSAPRSNVEKKGLWDINETPTGQVNDFGLIPNGNSSVTIKYSDGESESVPVVNNVVAISGPRISRAPVAATYNDAEGKPVTERLPVPGPAPAGPGPTEG